MNLAVRMYSLDSVASGPMSPPREVAASQSCVLADYDGRLLVVATPPAAPTTFRFMSMDSPEKTSVSHVAYGDLGASVYLLDLPQRGAGVALALTGFRNPAKPDYPSALEFTSLKSPDTVSMIPLGDLKYLRFGGSVGGALDERQCTPIIQGGDTLGVVVAPAVVPIGIPRPGYLKERAPESYALVESTESLTVLKPSEPGVIDVLNKAKSEWHRVAIPFAGARIRGFGHWLSAIETKTSMVVGPSPAAAANGVRRSAADVSPGADKRRSEEIAPAYRRDPALTVDDLFEKSRAIGVTYTGELLVCNVETGTQLRIPGGSGDSEVIFVNDDAVFYRVDDAIFRRDIHGSSLGEAVKLAEGGDIAQVHWAFLD